MNPLFHTDFSISDSLIFVRKSVLIYETIIETAMSIMQILEDSVHQMNKCAVIVTHSNEIAKKADVVFQLKRGTLHIVKNNEKV